MTTAAGSPRYYHGYGAKVEKFAHDFVIQTKGRWAGDPLDFLPWERELVNELYLVDETEALVYREALIGVARKNGKSTLGATIALHGLLAANENEPEVYAAAASKEQAGVVFNQAKKFVERSPKLSDWLTVRRNYIECKANGGIFRVLSSDAPLQYGLNPSVVVIDELWAHKNRELYDALTTGDLARENPLIISITTAGWDRSSICWETYEYGMALAAQGLSAMRAERFFFKWFAMPEQAKIDDREAWRLANPSPWIGIEDLARKQRKMPPNVFRRLHGNQWTETEDAWISPSLWDACAGTPVLDPIDRSWTANDVGIRKDSSAFLHAQWHDHDPDTDKLLPAGHGRAPDQVKSKLHIGHKIMVPDPQHGRIYDIADIREALARDVATRPGTQGVPYDPWGFRESAEDLQDRGLPMVEWPQGNARMCPASETIYELVADGRIVHDADLELRRQVLAAVAADTDRGWRISKRKSRDRIDACVALAMAADIAVSEKQEASGGLFDFT